MELLNHDIVHEFPQLEDKIRTLRTSHARFGRAFTEYDEINHTIGQIEQDGLVISDMALENLKKQRLHLKDEIVYLLHS